MNIPVLNVWDESQKKYVGIPAISGGGKIKQEQLPAGYPWEGDLVIEWDGDTTGRTTIYSELLGATLVKVAGVPEKPEDLLGGKLTMTAEGEEIELPLTTETMTPFDGVECVMFGEFGVVAAFSSCDIAMGTFVLSIPQPGIYLVSMPGVEITYLLECKGVKLMDSRYYEVPETNNRMIVNITEDDSGTCTADKTFAKVSAMIDAGNEVVATCLNAGGQLVYAQLVSYVSGSAATFAVLMPLAVGIAGYSVTMYANGNISVDARNYAIEAS